MINFKIKIQSNTGFEKKMERIFKKMSFSGFELVRNYYNCLHSWTQNHTGHIVNYDFKRIYKGHLVRSSFFEKKCFFIMKDLDNQTKLLRKKRIGQVISRIYLNHKKTHTLAQMFGSWKGQNMYINCYRQHFCNVWSYRLSELE